MRAKNKHGSIYWVTCVKFIFIRTEKFVFFLKNGMMALLIIILTSLIELLDSACYKLIKILINKLPFNCKMNLTFFEENSSKFLKYFARSCIRFMRCKTNKILWSTARNFNGSGIIVVKDI